MFACWCPIAAKQGVSKSMQVSLVQEGVTRFLQVAFIQTGVAKFRHVGSPLQQRNGIREMWKWGLYKLVERCLQVGFRLPHFNRFEEACEVSFIQEEVAKVWPIGLVVAPMARFGQLATCRTRRGLNKQGKLGCIRWGQDAFNLVFPCHKGRRLKMRGIRVFSTVWQDVGMWRLYLCEWEDFGELTLYKH